MLMLPWGVRRCAASLLALLSAVLMAPGAHAEADSFGNGNGHNGPLTVNAADTVVNVYTRLTSSASVGSTFVNVADTAGFAAGDLLMIYQSTGFTGAVTSGDEGPFDFTASAVGNWQFVRVTALTGTRLTFAGHPLTAAFTGGTSATAIRLSAQAIKVPEFTTVTVNAGASIVARPWAGVSGSDNLGGIVIFFATGTVTNNGTISATGAGFRGAAFLNGEGDNCAGLDQNWPGGALKGEGPVPARYNPPSAYPPATGSAGRGNILNAGGGGVCHNAGGGGGGNGGRGGREAGPGAMRPPRHARWAASPGARCASSRRSVRSSVVGEALATGMMASAAGVATRAVSCSFGERSWRGWAASRLTASRARVPRATRRAAVAPAAPCP
ncbi:hypothetical protein [Melittangium boletus]|uniref:hypothetical protein n=1 Tax=Melittangium boletus TaxID=83453 RepID=UPI003DA1F54C